MDKFWAQGRELGRLVLKSTYKLDVVAILRDEIRVFLVALENSQSLVCASLIMERADSMIKSLTHKRSILEEIKHAIESEKEYFEGK